QQRCRLVASCLSWKHARQALACAGRGSEMQPFFSTLSAPSEQPHTPSLPASTVEALGRRSTPPSRRGVQAAHWGIWGLLAFFVVAVAMGRAWDGAWHATHTFDRRRPPHATPL